MKPDYETKDGRARLFRADCLGVLKTMDAESVSSIVVDPPYGLKFMGKKWDCEVPSVEIWAECLRVLKPGGHLLCFAGTRTQHRMAVNIEDAGFEIRDMLAWVYASGFPKSLDVSKAIDKAAGAEREVIGVKANYHSEGRRSGSGENMHGVVDGSFSNPKAAACITAPATDAAKQWQGWGTALKPAMEPITVTRKPLIGTVAENVQKFGTGAINIDGCRVELRGEKSTSESRRKSTFGGKTGVLAAESNAAGKINRRGRSDVYAADHGGSKGRWPANLILTYPEDQRGPDGNLSPNPGKDEVVGLFPNVGKAGKHGGGQGGFNSHGGHNCYGKGDESFDASGGYADSGSAARFFKCCPPDEICSLCGLTWSKASDTVHIELQERSSLWKSMFALSAEKNGWTSEATAACTARMSAITSENEKLVQNVKSAGSLCDSCATRIAVGLVGIKTSAFSEAELQAILDCTGNCNASILTRCLASFAGLWENIATIPTTTSLSLLFGSVRDAIANYTKPESAEAAGQKSAQRRFAYHSKASKADRDEGCEGLEERMVHRMGHGNNEPDLKTQAFITQARNHHPTVKPTDLMRYLCRLVTPPGGIVLDPFMGSGSTGRGAILEGFNFVGIELDPDYFDIAVKRIEASLAKAQEAPVVQKTLFE